MREEKPYFSAVVEIWMAFGITRAVFSFVIACTLWKGIVSFGEEEGEGREREEGEREGKGEKEKHYLIMTDFIKHQVKHPLIISLVPPPSSLHFLPSLFPPHLLFLLPPPLLTFLLSLSSLSTFLSCHPFLPFLTSVSHEKMLA